MCDYCDCRSITEIGDLSNEHEHVLSVCHRLRHQPGDATDVASLLAELRSLLEPHTQREEAGIFAVLAAIDCDPAYRRRFLDDHVDIDRALVIASTDHTQIPALVELVERHVFEEETDLYPAIRQLFAPADWDDVDHRLRHLTTTDRTESSELVTSTM